MGLVVGLGLAGNAAATAVVAVRGERLGRLPALLVATVLSAGGLLAMALGKHAGALGLGAFIGLVNGMGRDRGPAQTVEQSVLADAVSGGERTLVFARYAFIQDLCGALGSLAAGIPALAARIGHGTEAQAGRATLAAAAVVSLLPLLLYARLKPGATAPVAPAAPQGSAGTSAETRRRVARLTGLFALDSLGGGFLAGSIVTYWFFRRFGVSGDVLGPLFFAGRILNGLSYYAADFLARRIGLIRTMVYTHLPSSAVLLALPFVGRPWMAIMIFLVRESLVQMDVPTRQAYVAAVTGPGERTFALGVTGLARNVGWAAGPALAGAAMASFGLGAPLIAGAFLKIVYDLALFASFRHQEVA